MATYFQNLGLIFDSVGTNTTGSTLGNTQPTIQVPDDTFPLGLPFQFGGEITVPATGRLPFIVPFVVGPQPFVPVTTVTPATGFNHPMTTLNYMASTRGKSLKV